MQGSRPIWQTSHILLFPPQAKPWADPLQACNDFMKRSIARIASVIRAELRHQVLCLPLPVQVERACLTHKEAPDSIARVRWAWLVKLKYQIGCAIPGEHIPAPPNDKSWMRIECIHGPLERRRDLFFLHHHRCRRLQALKKQEMLLFGCCQPERLHQ